LLTPYHANFIPGRTQLPLPPIKVKGQQEYEIEEVLNSKIVRNKLRYLVSLVGYSNFALATALGNQKNI
jgi:hypothetical protein